MLSQNQTRSFLRISVIASLISSSAQLFAASWEQQAERLQMVSASLLDAQPLLSPTIDGQTKGSFRLEGKAIISVLPKMNATVGGKSEQPPQPPAHSIPTIEGSYQSPQVGQGVAILRGWGGYLPESAAKTTGMKAKAKQTIFGYSLGIKLEGSPLVISNVEIGEQTNSTFVSGGITEPEASDEFDVKTKLRFASLTITPKIFDKLWLQAQIAERTVALRFDIPADGTTFNLNDRSTAAGGNAATQFSVGYRVKGGLQAAIGVLNVPQRVTMPRLLLSYGLATGGAESATSLASK
ncbi:MAG: hypothetical protein NT027_11360 [Proteobacteria bacterium]|nr:hypothetical protein [Pseudomonadota bacterium]